VTFEYTGPVSEGTSPFSVDPLLSHRDERFRFEVLDKNDVLKGALDGVVGGELSWSIYNTIRSGGSIQLVDRAQDIDWYSDRIRVFYGFYDLNGQFYEWPLGVFLPATPMTETDGVSRKRKVDLFDKLLVLDQDMLEESYTIDADVVVTDAVRDIIEEAGESAVAITASLETLSTPKTWPAGTTKLQMINDLLASINYFSLEANGAGAYVASPYSAPAYRPLAWTFREGEAAVHLPDMSHELDLFSIPNKVVLATEDADEEPLIGIAMNIDPTSRLSYQGRGRWITYVESGVEATSQEAIDGQAERVLAEQMQASETVVLRHVWLPAVTLNSVARAVSTDLFLDSRYAIVSQDMSLSAGSLCKTTVRRVVT